MARPLTFALDEVMQRPKRRPFWRVELFDVRSTNDTIGSIVRGLTLDPLTGPLDITDHVSVADVNEVAGDFAASGIPSTSITIAITDPTPGGSVSVWDPQFSADDTSLPARFIRRGNVLRLYEGDLDVDPSDWPCTFTGKLAGHPGVDRNRASGVQGVSTITIVAVSREAAFVNLIRTSDDFARLTTYLTMAETVAQEDMQLDADEIEFSAWGASTTGLKMQFVEQSPIVTIAQLMFSDGFLPRFNGEGKLSQTFADAAKAPARIYLDESTIVSIVKTYSDLDPVNSVSVVGIEGVKSKVAQPRQILAEISLTTGYFTNDEEIEVFWTDDQTQLAENVKLKVIKSVNGGLSKLGGGETWVEILSPGMGGLAVGARMSISTGFSPYIVIFLALVYIVLAIIPDTVQTVPVEGTGITIPVGRIIQAVALAAILILMTKIGRGVYKFTGDPVEYVYREITGIAEIDGTLTEDLVELVIKNHTVQTQADADAAALLVLFRQQARGNPRAIQALHDVRLEPHDVFEISDGRRFLIESIRRRLVRAQPDQVLANYSVSEVTPGLAP